MTHDRNGDAAGDLWPDFALADCFCQVAGVYINTAGNRTSEEFFISDRIGQWLQSPRSCSSYKEKSKRSEWEVYACHHQPSPRKFICDIFVFDPKDGSLLQAIIGVH